MDGTAEFWKKKYEESESNLQTLKELAHKGVADYEQLKQKYDQNYKQYEELKVELEDAREKLASFDYYAKEAVQEFDALEKKCELQHDLVQEVSKYASQVTKEKKRLQRQSQALLDKFSNQLSLPEIKKITEEDLNLNGDASAGNELDGEQKQLLARVEALQGDVASLEARLEQAVEERDAALQSKQHVSSKLESEKQRVHRLEICVKEHQKSINKFQRVSLLAIQEHEELQSKLVMERDLKEAVVKEAQKIENERKTVVRQSAAAILEASADEKLAKALENIEELSRKLGDTEIKFKEKEEELKEATDNCAQRQNIESLQLHLDEATDEIKKLETQVKEQTKWNEKLTKDYAALEKKLEAAEARFVPPPPPPPPPPPALLRPILKIIRKPTKPHPQAAKDKPPEFQKALEELMGKIRRGDPLTGSLRSNAGRSTSVDESRHQEEKPGNSAMHEMQSMLKKMNFKKSYSESEAPQSPEEKQKIQFQGPLADAFKKVRGERKTQTETVEQEEVFEV